MQELKFRYEKMARTLRSLRTDPHVMSYQREELHDLCALLARHEALIKHAVLNIGLRPLDADAVLAPLQRELHILGASSSSTSTALAPSSRNQSASGSSLVPSGSPRIDLALGEHNGKLLAINRSEQSFRSQVDSDEPRTEIVLHAAGAVSEEKIRRMQRAIARIFADHDDDEARDDEADDEAIDASRDRVRRLRDAPTTHARRLAMSPAGSVAASPARSEDDEFFSADEDEFNASLDDSMLSSPGSVSRFEARRASPSAAAAAVTTANAASANAAFDTSDESGDEQRQQDTDWLKMASSDGASFSADQEPPLRTPIASPDHTAQEYAPLAPPQWPAEQSPMWPPSASSSPPPGALPPGAAVPPGAP